MLYSLISGLVAGACVYVVYFEHSSDIRISGHLSWIQRCRHVWVVVPQTSLQHPKLHSLHVKMSSRILSSKNLVPENPGSKKELHQKCSRSVGQQAWRLGPPGRCSGRWLMARKWYLEVYLGKLDCK